MCDAAARFWSTTEREDNPPCRRFTILDGMILIAATAILLLGMRGTLRSVLEAWAKVRSQGFSPLSRPEMWAASLYALVVAGVGILTLTFLVIRLRKPRPALGCLIWQPGMLACTTICMFIPLLFVMTGRRSAPSLWLCMSASVALAWLAAWSSGRMRPEAGWIDRLGRVLGVCWIAFAVYPLWLLSQA
jgi:hypothetical protein